VYSIRCCFAWWKICRNRSRRTRVIVANIVAYTVCYYYYKLLLLLYYYYYYYYCDTSVIVVVSAQDEERSGVRFNPNHLHHVACLSDNHGFINYRHHWWNLSTMERLQQWCYGISSYFIRSFRYVSLASDIDGVLLLENCLHTKIQGTPANRINYM